MKIDPKRIWLPGSALLKRWEAVNIRRQDLINIVLNGDIPAYNSDTPDYDDENLKDVVRMFVENNSIDCEDKLNLTISAELDDYLFNLRDIINFEAENGIIHA